MLQSTATSGVPQAWRRDGRPIALGAGYGPARGGGRGWQMSLGASHLFTMDAGRSPEMAGSGFRDRALCGLSMRPRSSAGLGAARPLTGELERLDGFPWRREKCSYRLIGRAAFM